jgi:hypothetical protein
MASRARLALSVIAALLVAAAAAGETIRVVAERADVQQEAKAGGRVLGTVSKGTVLQVLGRESGWVRVAYPLANGAFYVGYVPAVLCEDAHGAAPSPFHLVAPAPPVGVSPAQAPAVAATAAPVPAPPTPRRTVYRGQKFDVEIIDRQDNSSSYTYVVPGYAISNSTTNVNCTAYSNSANCTGFTNATGLTTPGVAGSWEVHGATLSLRLPDGRIAVVNCTSKTNWNEWNNPSVYRSCRVPMVAHIQAEFDGDKAKLKWPVSIDGSKMQSETYKILAVLEKP